MKLRHRTLRNEPENHVREDCNTERGSNQWANTGTRARQRRRNAERAAGGGGRGRQDTSAMKPGRDTVAVIMTET